MSILAYVGLPGSGKSYDVVANQVVPALKAGRRVATNIPLNRDVIRKDIPGGEIVELPLDRIATQPETIDEYATAGTLLIIDECWRLWPTGTKADKVPVQFRSLLAEHRHKVDAKGNAMQIVFVCQDLAQLAAFARQLVELTFHHTKLSHMGMRGTYRIDVFHGAVTGAVPPVSNRLREQFGKYSPKVFKYYQSHTMSDSSRSGANEVPLDGRGNALMRPLAIAGMVVIFAAGIWGSTWVYGLTTGERELVSVANESRPPVGAERQAGPGASATGPLSPSLRAPARPSYRVVGHVRRATGGGVALIDVGGRVHQIDIERCWTSPTGPTLECAFEDWVVTEVGVGERIELR